MAITPSNSTIAAGSPVEFTSSISNAIWSLSVDPSATGVNFAAASQGSTASSTSNYSVGGIHDPAVAIDGVRYPSPSNNYWICNDNVNTSPQDFIVDFGQFRTINRINVFSLPNDYNSSAPPTLTDTFTTYGLSGFTVSVYDGAKWIPVSLVTGNNLIWKMIDFAPKYCSKIKIHIFAAPSAYACICEVEAIFAPPIGNLAPGSTAYKENLTGAAAGTATLKAIASQWDPASTSSGLAVQSDGNQKSTAAGYQYSYITNDLVISAVGDSNDFIYQAGTRRDCLSSNVQNHGIGSDGKVQYNAVDVGVSSTFVDGDFGRFKYTSGGGLEVYRNGNLIYTFNQNAAAGQFYRPYIQIVSPYPPVGSVFVGYYYSGTNAKGLAAESTPVTVIIPLTADFTLSSLPYNYGSVVSAIDSTVGGSGTKTRIWKIDGVTVSQTDPLNAVFSGLSLGLHTISLAVSDSSANSPNTKTVTIFIGQVTGADYAAKNASSTFATNISSPVWSASAGTITSGGIFTAPNSTGNITITAASADGTQRSTKTIAVFTAPTISSISPLPSIVIGNDFAQQLAAAGGSGAGTWSIVTNDPSQPITLSSSGLATRSAPAIGAINFTVRFTDANSNYGSVDKAFQVTITPPPPIITSKTPLPYGQIGHPYSFQLKKSGGAGAGTWIATVGNLPDGALSSNGLITIPSVGSSNYTFTARYTDDASFVEKAFTIPVSVYAAITFIYKRPLQIDYIQKQRYFEPLSGDDEVIEDAPMKREFTLNVLFSNTAEGNYLRQFMSDHRNREKFLWVNPDRNNEVLTVKMVSKYSEQQLYADGYFQIVIREV